MAANGRYLLDEWKQREERHHFNLNPNGFYNDCPHRYIAFHSQSIMQSNCYDLVAKANQAYRLMADRQAKLNLSVSLIHSLYIYILTRCLLHISSSYRL
jgi:hypothetical protein